MSLLETSLLFFSLVSVTVQQLVIKPSGDSLIKSLRSSMVITCSILNSDANVDVKWLDTSGTEVTNRGGGRVYLEVEGATKKLYITSIIKSDAGRYTCIGNLSGILQERSIRLVLFQDITFDVAPAEQHPQIYTDALIHCEVSANPPPTVTWKFNRQKLHMGGRFSQVADGLRITNISQSDNGEYVCCAEVESAGRFDERAIVVSVHIPPKILFGPGKSEGIKGRQFTMSCSADSFPLPNYRFYKMNGDVKDPVLSTSRINVNASHGTIHFLPLSKSDEGSYLCTAFNDVGNDSASGEIRVLVPTTITNTSSIVATEGESVTLFCQAEGDPMPGLEFGRTRTGMPCLRGDNEGGKIVVSSPSEGVLEMLIKDVTPNDAGNYSCFARNAIEEDIRHASLTVEFKPRFLVDQKRVTYIWADTTRSMSCHFEGVPAPSVEWFQGRRPIQENETYQVSTSRRFSQLRVHVREVDQGWIYGDYTCKIKNHLGESDMTVDLRRATIPDAPMVSVKKCLPTEVVLDVIAPEEDGGVEILGYIVEYLGKPEDFNIGTEVRVQNLSPGTTYQLTIRARNEVGLGTPVQVPATTKTICEPYPVNIVSKPEGSEAFQYRIAWQVVSNGGMDITEYEFKYRKVIDDRVNSTQTAEIFTTKIVKDDPNHPLDYLLEDLDPNCRYELEIRAKNPMGWSRPSQTFFFRTYEDSTEYRSGPVTESNFRSHASLYASSNASTVAVGGAASPADMEKYRPMAADSLTLLIPVIVIGIFIVLLTIDIVAYKLCGCGITSCICVHLCHRKGRDRVNAKNSDGRDGDEKPLSEFEKNNDRDSTVECKTWEYAEKERLKNHKSLRDNQPVPV